MMNELLDSLVDIIKTRPLLIWILLIEVFAWVAAPFLPGLREVIRNFGYFQYIALAIFIQIPVIAILALIAVIWSALSNE